MNTKKLYSSKNLLYIYRFKRYNNNILWGLVKVNDHKHLAQLRVTLSSRLAKSTDYNRAYKTWEMAFKNRLTSNSSNYEDIELEYLLQLRHFNQTLKSSKKAWKNSEVFNFFYRISGLQDIQNAVPLSQGVAMNTLSYTEEAPEPIALPKVSLSQSAPSINSRRLSTFIPKNCYYVEFPNLSHMKETLDFIDSHFQLWAPGVYPKSFKKSILDAFKKVVPNMERMLKSPELFGKIAIAGWDPYFQSGTSLLFIIEKGAPNGVVKKHYIRDNVGVYSTSEKLLKKSNYAYRNNESLEHDPHFRYARKRLAKNKDEKFFLFLSDYWLTHFLSPKWQILSRRLAECDARIRLTELLRLVYKVEENQVKLPSIEAMKKAYAQKSKLIWIMRDLILVNGKVVHKSYGGLNKHKTIDELPLGNVSIYEKKTYETFKRNYLRK